MSNATYGKTKDPVAGVIEIISPLSNIVIVRRVDEDLLPEHDFGLRGRVVDASKAARRAYGIQPGMKVIVNLHDNGAFPLWLAEGLVAVHVDDILFSYRYSTEAPGPGTNTVYRDLFQERG